MDFYWTKTEEPVRISEYASELGFNLRSLEYSGLSENKWSWINSKVKSSIVDYIAECWEDEDEERSGLLSEVKQGVYVITLADNLSIDYDGKPSKVLYIGRGKIRERLAAHFTHWIRHITESLQDISFDVWLTEIKTSGSKEAFKDVEADLLADFYEKFGSHPLQNSKSGDSHMRDHKYCSNWNKPLKNTSGINKGWSIKPLKNNDWALDFDEY